MDIKKLKLDEYHRIKAVNFPERYELGIETVDNQPEVIIYYIDKVLDVVDFVEMVKASDLPKDNRVIFVYEKGRKDGVNRDTIFAPFKAGTYPGFKMRSPMMCSLSKELSAFVQSYEITKPAKT
jgi:hypothetical protein